ncbi:rRNA processing protein, partial [Linderina macrospora]
MPKASKKKQRKAEDFKKVKLKVGKKKAPPTNTTDTSFTSKSITLGAQSITADKTEALTNSRKLTLKDVLTQMRHYSAATRKDAVLGLTDFLTLHPEVLNTELGSIIDGTVKLIVDNEPAVRRVLLKLYSSYLPDVPRRELAPFTPLMVIFTCSGMTHILDDIRSDAVKFLNLLIELAPQDLSQYASKILPNFFSLLETNTQSSEDSRGSASLNSRTSLLTKGNRLDIMRSCYNYLKVYTDPLLRNDDPLGFMSPDVGGTAHQVKEDEEQQSWQFPDGSIYFYPNTPAPFAHLNLFGESVGAGASSDATSGDANAVIRAQSKEAFTRLFQFLQATWMESSTMFGTNQIADDQSLDLCGFVMRILQTLWQASYKDSIPLTDKQLFGFTRQCMVHFPFGGAYVGSNTVEESLLAMNIKVCELVARLRSGAAGSSSEKAVAEVSKWTKRCVKFILTTLGFKLGKTQVQVSAAFRHEHFVELLPVVWRLVHCGNDKYADKLLMSVIHYADVCPLASANKTLCIRFLRSIIEIQWSRASTDRAVVGMQEQLSEMLANWALGLPKLLWQLRDKNFAASRAAIETLRLINQRTKLLDASQTDTLQSSLVTLFCVTVPSKGTVFGPFKQYPDDLQCAVLETVHYCPRRSDRLAQAMQACQNDITSGRAMALLDELVTAPS